MITNVSIVMTKSYSEEIQKKTIRNKENIRIMEQEVNKCKVVRVLPSEIVEATEDGGMCRLLALLAADNPAFSTLLQVGSYFRTGVILQERLTSLLQLLYFSPVLQDRAGDPI